MKTRLGVVCSAARSAASAPRFTTDVAQAYLDVVYRYLGQERQHRFIEDEKRSFFGRLFG